MRRVELAELPGRPPKQKGRKPIRGEQRKEGRKVDRGSERAVDRGIEGDHDGTEERKVNGEFNLVWQPPFPLRRKKRNERKRERGGKGSLEI